MRIIFLIFILFIIFGVFEKKNHRKNLANIPYIIHVNGTRGKSSTTRLIAGALQKGGLKVLAKTTGTSPRIIYPDGSEREIIRHGPPSISEQKKIVKLAAQKKVDILVIECMAISPEIQWSSQNQFLKADLTVITNIRHDHLDVMGESISEIAETIALSLPVNKKVISTAKESVEIIKRKSLEKGNEFISALDSLPTKEELNDFKWPVFSDNIACAIKIASILSIDRKIALQGMHSIKQDPGNLQYYLLKQDLNKYLLINAFAANDSYSTKIVWNKAKSKNFIDFGINFNKTNCYALINHRSDRSFRLNEFISFLTDSEIFQGYILTGALKYKQKKLLMKNGIPKDKIFLLNINRPFFKLNKNLSKISLGQDLILFGCGNIHGNAEKIVSFFAENGVEIL